MTSLKQILLAGTLCGLAACATPEQQCINAATKNLRTLDALIAQTQGNLDRGFAIQTKTEIRPRLTFCYGRSATQVGYRFCTRNQAVRTRVPVAIDLNAERRKLSSLREKRLELERSAQQALAACAAAQASL